MPLRLMKANYFLSLGDFSGAIAAFNEIFLEKYDQVAFKIKPNGKFKNTSFYKDIFSLINPLLDDYQSQYLSFGKIYQTIYEVYPNSSLLYGLAMNSYEFNLLNDPKDFSPSELRDYWGWTPLLPEGHLIVDTIVENFRKGLICMNEGSYINYVNIPSIDLEDLVERLRGVPDHLYDTIYKEINVPYNPPKNALETWAKETPIVFMGKYLIEQFYLPNTQDRGPMIINWELAARRNPDYFLGLAYVFDYFLSNFSDKELNEWIFYFGLSSDLGGGRTWFLKEAKDIKDRLRLIYRKKRKRKRKN